MISGMVIARYVTDERRAEAQRIAQVGIWEWDLESVSA